MGSQPMLGLCVPPGSPVLADLDDENVTHVSEFARLFGLQRLSPDLQGGQVGADENADSLGVDPKGGAR